MKKKKMDMEEDVNEGEHEVGPPMGMYLVLQWKDYGVVSQNLDYCKKKKKMDKVEGKRKVND